MSAASTALGWTLLGFTLAFSPSLLSLLKRLWTGAELYEGDSWWDEVDRSESFSSAAEALARRLWAAAGLKRGERVCDVGFGSGESVRLLAEEFAPAKLLGVTSLEAQHRRAVSLVARTNLGPARVELVAGDATTALSAFEPASVDVVFALDCAYHFNTREAFLRSAHTLLAPGGRIALTDLVLPSRALSSFESVAIRLLYLLAGLPLRNLVTAKAYEEQMREMGYEDVRVEVISDYVWPGFCAFVDRRESELGGVLNTREWGGLRRYKSVVEWYADLRGGGKRRKLEFVMVTARKA